MPSNTYTTIRLFGGKEPQPTTGKQQYQRPLMNENDQAVVETLAVGTHNRVFPGPRGPYPCWSIHGNITEVAAATSSLKFYYSDLPNPDPGEVSHWKLVDAAKIPTISLDSADSRQYTIVNDMFRWIKAEAVVVGNTCDLWLYAMVSGVNNN